jgi:hypothetical protein
MSSVLSTRLEELLGLFHAELDKPDRPQRRVDQVGEEAKTSWEASMIRPSATRSPSGPCPEARPAPPRSSVDDAPVEPR